MRSTVIKYSDTHIETVLWRRKLLPIRAVKMWLCLIAVTEVKQYVFVRI